MADFSHWDFAEDFDAWDAAALILGVEPSASEDDEARIRVVRERMESDYRRALRYCLADYYDAPPFVDAGACLYSTAIRRLENWAKLTAGHSEDPGEESPRLPTWWANDREAQKFGNQRFTRASLAAWLRQIGQRSVYSFAPDDSTTRAVVADEVDPADLPFELQAANIAFRAVLNGYGASDATFKNRLVDYLTNHFKGLKPEAVKRIATVANPDKEPGRKRRSSE